MKSAWSKMGIALGTLAVLGAVGFSQGQSAQAATSPNGKRYGVYFRSWLDKSLVGVQTGANVALTQGLDDIPWGVDYLTVFGPTSDTVGAQAQAASPFYQHLATYADTLHARGTQLLKATGYKSAILPIAQRYNHDMTVDFDQIAKDYADNLVFKYHLDGIDVDMEMTPTAEDVAWTDQFFAALGHYLGPQSINPGTLMVYDTVDGHTTAPLVNVSQYFSYLGNQQYGSTSSRTVRDFTKFGAAGIAPSQILAGLSFVENNGANWGDTGEDYNTSHVHELATASAAGEFMGMFMYAVDRDGRSATGPDHTTLGPSTFRWTKASILETKGYTLAQTKAAAEQHITRVAPAKNWSASQIATLQAQIAAAPTIFDVITVFITDDFDTTLDASFDPFYEINTPLTDTAPLEAALQAAGATQAAAYTDASWQALAATVTAGQDLLATHPTAAAATQAATTIGQAIAALVPADTVPVDKTHLTASLKLAAEVTDDGYSDSTWAALVAAQTTAQQVAADPAATQDAITVAAAELARAVYKLVQDEQQPQANKEALTTLIAGLPELTETDYHPTTWQTYVTALAAAKTLKADTLATQTAVDTQVQALQAALAGLLPSDAQLPAEAAKARVTAAAAAHHDYMVAVAAQREAAAQAAAYQAGRQIGETNAARPDLSARTSAYQEAFAAGEKVGLSIRKLKAFLATLAQQAALAKQAQDLAAQLTKDYPMMTYTALQQAAAAGEPGAIAELATRTAQAQKTALPTSVKSPEYAMMGYGQLQTLAKAGDQAAAAELAKRH
ncbi:EndoS/ChiA family endoglycosidase [Lacticaseibacillus daqingensis]|uniref:EndoS/ChiA family endoglycosidase n=1 Tax=Lacticaseibacillus daqingensis TaxID=2486014 RepID=UPI000F7B05DD|nr:hypothetical protein [Lacticaseibacillus daqingensis]